MTLLLDRPRPVVLPESTVEAATRRGFLVGGAALGLLLATGCGTGEEASVAGGAVTLAHAYGSTEVPTAPTRVVTVGYTDHDVVLALGVTPIGVREWYGDHPHGVWPWAQDELGSATPTVLRGEDLSVEQVAELGPDLILGLYANLSQTEYEQLSRIAPTVPQSGGHAPYSTPWQEMTRTAGAALGRQERAEQLIAQVEEQFAAARAQHPRFEGAQLVYAGAYGQGQVYVESSGSTRFGLLAALGFAVPGQVDALVEQGSFSADISDEQLRLIDHDVLFWELGAAEGMRAAIEAKPLYPGLDVVRGGRVVYVDDPLLAGALAHATVLSLPTVLEALVPMLAAAVAAR